MSDLEDLKEEASVARKWAVEKQDLLANMAFQKLHAGDPASISRRAAETKVMFRVAARCEARIAAIQAREKAA